MALGAAAESAVRQANKGSSLGTSPPSPGLASSLAFRAHGICGPMYVTGAGEGEGRVGVSLKVEAKTMTTLIGSQVGQPGRALTLHSSDYGGIKCTN